MSEHYVMRLREVEAPKGRIPHNTDFPITLKMGKPAVGSIVSFDGNERPYAGDIVAIYAEYAEGNNTIIPCDFLEIKGSIPKTDY